MYDSTRQVFSEPHGKLNSDLLSTSLVRFSEKCTIQHVKSSLNPTESLIQTSFPHPFVRLSGQFNASSLSLNSTGSSVDPDPAVICFPLSFFSSCFFSSVSLIASSVGNSGHWPLLFLVQCGYSVFGFVRLLLTLPFTVF